MIRNAEEARPGSNPHILSLRPDGDPAEEWTAVGRPVEGTLGRVKAENIITARINVYPGNTRCNVVRLGNHQSAGLAGQVRTTGLTGVVHLMPHLHYLRRRVAA